MAQQQLAQSDPALDAFEKLKFQVVYAEDEDTASTFLAKFQSTAASLEPDERIKLRIYTHGSMELVKALKANKNVELLQAVLADPQADKICALHWVYNGEEDVNLVIPLLINNCPELASLLLQLQFHSEFDLVSSVLEHPSSKLKVIEMPPNAEGNQPRFFAALEQSQVSVLTINGCGYQGLCEYLSKDLQVRLTLRMKHKQVPFEVMMSLAKCTRLVKLNMWQCDTFQPTAFAHLPKSITKLELTDCRFADDFDWSFLAGSGVRELVLDIVKGMHGHQLGGALAVHLRGKGLDDLCLSFCAFADETLAAVGVELGRVKRLDVSYADLNDDSVELIALVLRSPSSELRELKLPYNWRTMRNIEDLVVPALRRPDCSLAKLSFWAYQADEAMARRLEDKFRNRQVLLVLLQGQQVKRKSPCLVRRLPVEMLRMVGEVLL